MGDVNGENTIAVGADEHDGIVLDTTAPLHETTDYGRAALDQAVAVVADDYDHLAGEAYWIGQLAAGGEIGLVPGARELKSAAQRAGMPKAEISRVLDINMAAGMRDPRTSADPDDTGQTEMAATVITLSTVTPERVEWLWPGRFPRGKLVILDGDPGAGKSTLMLDCAARVTTGKPWPDGQPGADPADVLIMSAEDGLADTIAPRLAAASADRARVHALTEVTAYNDDGEPRQVPPSLPRDIPLAERIIRERGVKLLIVDVLMAYLSGRVDSHRDQDVRGVLHQLSAMAERTSCTIVLIRHLRKSHGGHAVYAGGGSIGIIGAARAAYLAGPDPDDDTGQRNIFATSKINVAVQPPSLAYRLVEDPEYGCGRIEWEPDPVNVTAAQLLRAPGEDEDRSERDAAAEWIVTYLTDYGGEAPAKDVKKAARGAGFAERTIDRARGKAGVDTARSGFGKGAVYVWRLGACSPPSDHVRHVRQDTSAGVHGEHGGSRGGHDDSETSTDTAHEGPELPW